jgi:hypothetical protein
VRVVSALNRYSSDIIVLHRRDTFLDATYLLTGPRNRDVERAKDVRWAVVPSASSAPLSSAWRGFSLILSPQGPGARNHHHHTVHSWLDINMCLGRSMSGTVTPLVISRGPSTT